MTDTLKSPEAVEAVRAVRRIAGLLYGYRDALRHGSQLHANDLGDDPEQLERAAAAIEAVAALKESEVVRAANQYEESLDDDVRSDGIAPDAGLRAMRRALTDFLAARGIVTAPTQLGAPLVDPVERFTDDDFAFLGALASDLLRRIWNHNPDIVFGAFDPFVLGETEDGELAVWLGQPDEATAALATLGDHEEGFERAVVWIVQHRDAAQKGSTTPAPTSTGRREDVSAKSVLPSDQCRDCGFSRHLCSCETFNGEPKEGGR